MKVTKQFLEDFDACEVETKRFLKLYPNGCVPTVTNLAILANTTYKSEHGDHYFLAISWLGDQLQHLDQKLYEEWDKLTSEIQELIGDEADDQDDAYAEADVAVLGAILPQISQALVNKVGKQLREGNDGLW